MKMIRFAFGSLIFVAFFAAASMAQNGRTFVSGAGLDTNPCSLTAPCRTFTQAISQTNAGGEVVVLTSAAYGPFTVNKALTVEAPAGVYAGITISSGSVNLANGINVNAGPADVVILRGLTINSASGGNSGIVFNSGRTLHIEGCIISGFSNDGIDIFSAGTVFVKDTIARGNDDGIFVDIITAGTTTITMDHVDLKANSDSGALLRARVTGAVVNVAIRSSSASGNSNAGMIALGEAGGAISLDIESCLIANNNAGIQVSADTDSTEVASISNCTISNNHGAGVRVAGTILSRGNNTFNGNGANRGTLTPLAAQ
jgi:hypothetical protein